jgi:putative endopeptidase
MRVPASRPRIERLDWMSPETKLKALDKLARLNVKIAYPDKWRDYSALRPSMTPCSAPSRRGLSRPEPAT